jgi:hypothetical protein
VNQSGVSEDLQMMGDRALALAQGLDELTHADLTFRSGGQHGQDPEPDGITEGAEAQRQLRSALGVEGSGQHRRTALDFVGHLEKGFGSGHGSLPLTIVDASAIIDASIAVNATRWWLVAPSGALNHLGIEVETLEQVRAATTRLTGVGLVPDVQESTTCCYAVQDKAWVDDPDGAPWEVYTVLADAPHETGLGCSTESCQPEPVTVDVAGSGRSCC